MEEERQLFFQKPEFFEDKIDKASKELGRRTGPNVLWLEEQFDDSKLALPSSDKFENGVPTLSRVLNDFEEGIACIAGKPNMGKSTLLVNMMLGACKRNDNILCVDLSLDDPIKKRYQQYLASLSGLHYQEIAGDISITENKDALKKEAHEKILKYIKEGKLMILEAQESYLDDDGERQTFSVRKFRNMISLMRQMRHKFPDKKIVFFIDAWNNLDYSGGQGSTDLDKTNYWLSELQAVTGELGIMTIVSAHLKKNQHRVEPSLDDIKGTSDMSYNCVYAAIVKNEYREGTKDEPLVHVTKNGITHPVVILETVKTKVSGWDFPLFFPLKSSQCGLLTIDHHEYVTYYEKYMDKDRK